MAAPPKNPYSAATEMWLEQFLVFSRREGKGVRLNEHGCLPYPGHMNTFLSAARLAIKHSMPYGGLKSFAVESYEDGLLNIGFETVMKHHPENGDWIDINFLLEDLTDQAASLSERTCCMCGYEPVKRASRFVKDGVPMPLCTRARHNDSAVAELLRPSFTLDEVKAKMKGKKFLSKRDGERSRARMKHLIAKAAE